MANGRRHFVFVVVGALFSALHPAPGRAAAPPTRPIVVLYALGQEAGAGVVTQNKGEQSPAERTLEATRSLRDRLAESGAVEPLIYAPKLPLFARAVIESRIKMARPAEPTPNEQVAVAKAVGAIYVLSVTTQTLTGSDGGYELAVVGTDCESGRHWNDGARIILSRLGPAGGESAVPVAGANPVTALNSAANTIATRLVNGPLGEYGRSTPPPSLLPPPAPKAPDAAAAAAAAAGMAPAAEDAARAARQQAEALIAQNDTGAAIVLLRRAVNQAPLDFALRTLLARAYLAARRGDAAASEAQRALALLRPQDDAARPELTRVLVESLSLGGDKNAARVAYEDVLKTQPDAAWARLALGGLFLSQNQPDAAEAQYRAVLARDAANRDAALGLARALAAKGDIKAAVSELAPKAAGPGTAGDFAARYSAATTLFDESAAQLAALLLQNRAAWEAKTLSRETFYKATTLQLQRANSLLTLLKQVPPPAGSPPAALAAHKRRLSAGSLLVQSVTSLSTYLETGDTDAGSQSALWLSEFQRELAAAQAGGAAR